MPEKLPKNTEPSEDKATKKPSEKKAKASENKSAKNSSEKKAKASENKSAKKPSEKKAKASENKSAKKPSEKKAKAPKLPKASKPARQAKPTKDIDKENKVSSKLKLLKVLDILKQTDEQHPVTANEIIDILADYGIPSERKSIARDISYLKEYGFDVMVHHDNKQGYFLDKRHFEDWEIKVLMDAVNSCKFLTAKDANILCDKLLSLPNKWGRALLNDIVVIAPPARTKESKIKYSIDIILSAIKNDVKIEFQYFDLDVDGESHSRKNGKFYQVTPYMLVWSSENYYLIGNTFDYNNISVYRLDRIKLMVATTEKRRDITTIQDYSGTNWLKDYISKTFSMHVGTETQIKVICKNDAIGKIFDRFGTSVDIKKWDKDTVIITLNVVESEALYAYFVLYSRSMQVIYPKDIVTKVSCTLKEGLEKYNSQFAHPTDQEKPD